MAFFRDSKIETYMRMWNTMAKAEPTVFVNNTKEGKMILSKCKNGLFLSKAKILLLLKAESFAFVKAVEVIRFLAVDSQLYAWLRPSVSP